MQDLDATLNFFGNKKERATNWTTNPLSVVNAVNLCRVIVCRPQGELTHWCGIMASSLRSERHEALVFDWNSRRH